MVFGRAHTRLGAIPDAAIQAAKTGFRVYFCHTTHGSQIMTGLSMLRNELRSYNAGSGTL